MKVLLVGGGGREHALGWSLARSPACDELLCLPGNPGLAELGATVEGVAPTDVGAVAALSAAEGVDLAVIGPEAPLAAGVVDALTSMGVTAFGPSRAAARLEASKSFAKDVMARAGVPTGSFAVFTDAAAAKEHLRRAAGPFVVKADGLAAGKGVLVTEDLAAAEDWVDRCLTGSFGGEGASVVVEEHLEGPELSVFAICDGERALPLQPARDYKRLADGDEGPNTGGMGSFSPVAGLPEGLVDEVMDRVVMPTLRQMATDGTPYRGFLYAGLALTTEGPKVIEFNCRLGDPETQAVLPLLETDLLGVLADAAAGRLDPAPLDFSGRAAVNVVLAAGGYPHSPRTGDAISGLGEVDDPDVLVFHAGTTRDERGVLRTAGGRVLSVVGLGDDVGEARARAYDAAGRIRWKQQRFRTDIAAP
ncbi:MAG: phosphoribosylamine--glycine ligase [Acidimicrobiia bacterium]